MRRGLAVERFELVDSPSRTCAIAWRWSSAALAEAPEDAERTYRRITPAAGAPPSLQSPRQGREGLRRVYL